MSGEGDVSSADILLTREKGFLQLRVSALFGAKNFGLKLMVFSHGQRRRGVEPLRTFCGQGGQFFTILCGRLLWTAPNVLYDGVVFVWRKTT